MKILPRIAIGAAAHLLALAAVGFIPAAEATKPITPPTIVAAAVPSTNITTQVQFVLNAYGYNLTTDGVYGPQTRAAVTHWQRANRLYVDGVVGPQTLNSLGLGATANQPATRLTPPAPPPAAPAGLNGLPFAPDGLDDCAEMNFYRVQFGLPERFAQIGWRESNCRNEDGVRTFCCYGYWQNYISSHLSPSSAYRSRIINECQVRGADDINSDLPLDKQRQACVTAVVFSISGWSPWAIR